MGEPKFMTIDRLEEVIRRQVWSPAGDTLKIKKGKGGGLQKRWPELQVGKAYSFEMGEFKGYPVKLHRKRRNHVGYYRGYKEGKLDGGYEERQRIIAAASFTVKLDGNRVIVDSHDWANLWRELGEK